MKNFTSFAKSTFVLAGMFMLGSSVAMAQDEEPVVEEREVVYSEDFETVTMTDKDGNALANSWSFGYGLSNGWKVVGGSIYGSDGSADYGFITSSGKGYDESNCYVEASYGSKNSASLYIPQEFKGEISFYAKATSSKTNGSITIFEADAEGNVSQVALQSFTIAGGSGWTEYTLDVDGKYIAINMVRAQLDQFVVYAKDDVQVEERKALEISSFFRDTEDYEVVATATQPAEVPFKVTVKNTGNVDLTAEEATVSLTENGEVVATAGAEVKAGEEVEITLNMSYTEAQAGTHVYNVKENVSGTEYQYSARVTVLTEAEWIATGISEAKSEQQQREVYTLGGQRVEKAVKGLYIVNGKKVVVK